MASECIVRPDAILSMIDSPPKSLCLLNDHENERQIRRADRCDSSESSDSGIAILSSTESSNSSGTSDITEPCSPYSSPRTVQSPEGESSSGCESESTQDCTLVPESWPSGGTAGYLYHLQDISSTNILEELDVESPYSSGKESPPVAYSVPPSGQSQSCSKICDYFCKSAMCVGRCVSYYCNKVGCAGRRSAQLEAHSPFYTHKVSGVCSVPLECAASPSSPCEHCQQPNKTNPCECKKGGHLCDEVNRSELSSCAQDSSCNCVTKVCESEFKLCPIKSGLAPHCPLCPHLSSSHPSQCHHCHPSRNSCFLHQTARKGLRNNKCQGKITEYFKVESRDITLISEDSSKSASLVASESIGLAQTQVKDIYSKTSCNYNSKPYGATEVDVARDNNETVVTLLERKRRKSGVIFDGPNDLKLKRTKIEKNDLSAKSETVQKCLSVLDTSGIFNYNNRTETVSSITVRFPPPKVLHKSKLPDKLLCKWKGCDISVPECDIFDHIQVQHVDSQVNNEAFQCQWIGCKVYQKSSCSLSWLKRHVVTHSGNKPFKCIVENCGQRFTSQPALERHVNGHFSQNSASGTPSGGKRGFDTTPTKLFKRNGKKVRLRKSPWKARLWDYFDAGIMERLQHNLYKVTTTLQSNDLNVTDSFITFKSSVVARRVDLNGHAMVLVSWFPDDILPDEWISESDLTKEKTVALRNLPNSSLTSLFCDLYGFSPGPSTKSKRKTKTSAS